jgi:hypothetical protein
MTGIPQLCGGSGTYQNQTICPLREACSNSTGTCQPQSNPFTCNNANPPSTALAYDLLPKDSNGSPVFPPGDAPSATGGTLRNGRYVPTRLDVYRQDINPDFTVYEMTFEFRNGFFQARYQIFIGTGAVLGSDEVVSVGTVNTSGTALELEVESCATGSCTGLGLSCDLPTFVLYSATPNGMVTYQPYSDGTTNVTTYSRQ